MKTIRTQDALGTVLCHDITKIVPGEFKGPAFHKGHIVTEEDIPVLLSLGKDHLYVWELQDGFVHENDAALRLAKAVGGGGLAMTEPEEGKVNLLAEQDGLLLIDEERLLRLNLLGEVAVATRSQERTVKKGDIVAGIRVIPLVFAEEKMQEAEAIAAEMDVISVLPFQPCKVGIITTGNEVYYGRIADRFGPVVKEKVEVFGCTVVRQALVPDSAEEIAQAVQSLLAEGCQLILTTGGMSVDPDDVTPAGIRLAGARIVSYGAPVLPGSVFLMAYMGVVPVLGLPGCVMYNSTTVFDLVLPLVLAGRVVTREIIARWGVGGLCLNCESCHFPDCSFGT
ncbi:molybdopterin-binding protein [Anaeromusa acidaminophila]|uniref:molybdopterin-binding protein n=1 Tax=Anaeromusa acidaminophila TaxID=81464 RepID=UPI000365C122|nr:molybdopterin-binding protein [Anaeromusa acidaminophila]